MHVLKILVEVHQQTAQRFHYEQLLIMYQKRVYIAAFCSKIRLTNNSLTSSGEFLITLNMHN
jgi:HKD family nuclease